MIASQTPTSIAVTVTGSTGLSVIMQGQVQVSNYPATQNVSGTVVVTTTGPLQIWSEGSIGVSGTVSVTPLSPSGFWESGACGVTGSINVYTSGLQGVSGTLTVTGSSGIYGAVGVTGMQITGSTFIGTPVTIGGTDINGFVRGLRVSTAGLLQTSGPTNVGNPNAFNPVQVGGQTTGGTITALITDANGVQIYTTYAGQAQAVSGSFLTGSTFGGYPVVAGGVYTMAGSGTPGFPTAYVKGLQTDVSGALYVTSTGSLFVSAPATNPVFTSLAPLAAGTGAASFTGSMGQLPGGAIPGVIKASTGTLYKVWCTNRSTGSIYVQLFNSNTTPAANAVPLASFPVPTLSGSQGGTGGTSPSNGGSTFNPGFMVAPIVDFETYGVNFSSGIAIGLSSTNKTYVAVGNIGSLATAAPLWDIAVMYI